MSIRKVRYSKIWSIRDRAAGFLLVFIGISIAYGQTTGNEAPSARADIKSECTDTVIHDLVINILKRGEGRTETGIRTTTWIPPRDEDNAKVKNCGEEAIVPLSQFLDSDEPRAQLLAVRLLGVVGGPGIVSPLQRALEPSRWVVVRTQALSSLMSAPKTDAIPIIRSVLSRDRDPQVQSRGNAILATLGDD